MEDSNGFRGRGTADPPLLSARRFVTADPQRVTDVSPPP